MPALPTVVTTYLTAIKNSLSTGSDLGSDVRGAALNYLRAQDMATVLDLLQDGLDQTTNLTVVSGTTTSLTDGAGTFVPDQQVGNYVVFDGNVTTALAGVSARITGNTDRVLTFATLSDAPASGDTYNLVGGMVDEYIDALRGADRSRGDAPAANVYGDHRIAIAGLLKLLELTGAVAASGTLTLTGNAANTETVTIGGKVYTFQDSLTDVDGNVDVGATASDSLDNLIAAINLGAGAGTAYAASTTLHPSVIAAAGTGDTMVVTAKNEVGPAGNSIDTTETLGAEGAWGATTLTGGALGAFTGRTVASLVTRAGSTTTVVAANLRGASVRIDEFRGKTLTIAGETRVILTNDEAGNCTLAGPLTSAPGTSVDLTIGVDEVGHSYPQNRAHPGGQPGENARLANLIDQAQTAVAAYTLPT